MTARRRYEPRVRVALGLLTMVLLAGPALVVRSCVANLSSHPVAQVPAMDDDRIVKLKSGATMLLGEGTASPKIIHWLQLETDDSTAFEIDDANFKQGSADPDAKGMREISQVAEILKADPLVSAQVVLAAGAGTADAVTALERSRAERIGAELIRREIPADRIRSVAEPQSLDGYHVIDHPGQQSRLFIVLSR